MGVLVFAGVWLYRIWEDYRAPGDEYEELRQYVKEIPEEEIPENPNVNDETQEEAEGNAEMVIDFEKLRQINPDIVAWIRIEAAGVDYPVVQGDDNEFYLHHTFSGEKSIAGSIFMDYRNTSDFFDEKVIIYGHNMKDGSMFAKLKDLTMETEPTATIIIPGYIFEYRLVKADYVGVSNGVYQLNCKKGKNKRQFNTNFINLQ